MMNRLHFIFVGFLITFASAWIGLAMAPSTHYRSAPGAPPSEADALIEQGRKLYLQNGCIYCHSQQVSPRNFRSDQARGWGARRTVASDYRNDKTGLFGTMRTGPDLANIGSRNPSTQWHYLHLYNPQLTSKGSVMPPFRFLFKRRKVSASPEPDAILLGDGDEIVPTPEARALVAYLISLKHDLGAPPEAFEPPAKP
jgi:cytochrome c oxidase cbb3-type subunit 2